jgi:hypothetical protein
MMEPGLVGVFIPIVALLVIAGIIWLVAYYRFRARSDMQQTVRLAMEKGTELGPEIMEKLSGPAPDKNKDFRSAVIWIASAVGLAGLGAGIGIGTEDFEVMMIFLGIGALPLAIGIGYLVISRFTRDQD